MPTATKQAANRRNAARSTGPRTPAGKAVARMNALAHGLRASAPTVPGEDPGQWEAFRTGIVAELAPAGVLEAELADRVAMLSWRLRRVTAYEAGVIARTADRAVRRVRGEEADENPLAHLRRRPDGKLTLTAVRAWVERATADLDRYANLARLYAGLSEAADDARYSGADAMAVLQGLTDYTPDDDRLSSSYPMIDPRHARFLLALGVPERHHDEPDGWDGWTAGVIRQGVARVAGSMQWTAERLLARAVRRSAADLTDERARLADLRRELAEVEQGTAIEEAEARRRSLVPGADVVGVVLKYEGHLHRQLVQTLHELERMRAARSDDPPPPPAALDVTVHAPAGRSALPALAGG